MILTVADLLKEYQDYSFFANLEGNEYLELDPDYLRQKIPDLWIDEIDISVETKDRDRLLRSYLSGNEESVETKDRDRLLRSYLSGNEESEYHHSLTTNAKIASGLRKFFPGEFPNLERLSASLPSQEVSWDEFLEEIAGTCPSLLWRRLLLGKEIRKATPEEMKLFVAREFFNIKSGELTEALKGFDDLKKFSPSTSLHYGLKKFDSQTNSRYIALLERYVEMFKQFEQSL